MSTAESAIGLILLVGLVALVMKWLTADKSETPPASDSVEALLAEVQGADPGAAAEVVAITSDGWAFVPDGEEVQLIPPGDPDDVVPVRSMFETGNQPQTDPDIQVMTGRGGPINPRTHKPVSSWKPGDHLDRGDYVGVRVKRGAPDFDPWRLEALGRDGEYRAWFFETEDAARAAHDLLERRIVVPRRDPHGDPVPARDEEFDEARRLDEETERALDSTDE